MHPLSLSVVTLLAVTATARAATLPVDRQGVDDLPGGAATYTGPVDRRVFSHPATDLPSAQGLDFRVGRGLFRRLWVTAPASTQAADGLGPLYNARSCAQCHPHNGRGRAPLDSDHSDPSLVMRVDVAAQNDAQRQLLASGRQNNIAEPVYGLQVQTRATAGHAAEARLQADYREQLVRLADGTAATLRHPHYRLTEPGYGALHAAARLSPRLAPPLAGLGLLDAIDDAAITAAADPHDADGDGISGRVNRVWSAERAALAIGRFGHKAGIASLGEQVQAAFASDIGISTPHHPAGSGDCSPAQTACLAAADGNSPQYDDLEANGQVTALVTLYTGALAVAARRDPGAADVLAGQRLFHDIGCSACHRPAFDIIGRDGSAQRIWPYTDLLLHDLGDGLADGRPEGDADGREWRTPPLWGIGLTGSVNDAPGYLHDGRARTLLEAILWHGGEALAQRDRVATLSTRARRQLIRFIESL